MMMMMINKNYKKHKKYITTNMENNKTNKIKTSNKMKMKMMSGKHNNIHKDIYKIMKVL
jgi:hypothetical protein